MAVMDLRDNWPAIRRIKGWMLTEALEPLAAVGQFQEDHAIRGNICEIGVYHGKFLTALSHLGREGEVAVGIDLFEDQHLNLNPGACGDRQKVVQNYAVYGGPTELRLVKADSLSLADHGEELTGELWPFRLFSVDGCHLSDYALNDLRFAARTLVDGGVVFLDDYKHPAWPGVEEGARQFLAGDGRLVPFLLAANKLFLTTPGFRDAYSAATQGMGDGDW